MSNGKGRKLLCSLLDTKTGEHPSSHTSSPWVVVVAIGGLRRHTMQVWKGWTATEGAPTSRALTWAEWCARQQGTLWDEQRQPQDGPFSERELARLSFVRWLCQTGRLDPREYDYNY
jgi:hypothetical protein